MATVLVRDTTGMDRDVEKYIRKHLRGRWDAARKGFIIENPEEYGGTWLPIANRTLRFSETIEIIPLS